MISQDLANRCIGKKDLSGLGMAISTSPGSTDGINQAQVDPMLTLKIICFLPD